MARSGVELRRQGCTTTALGVRIEPRRISADGLIQTMVIGLLDFIKRTKQSFLVAKQADEVKRLLGVVYSLPNVNRHDVIESVRINEILLLGLATTYDLAIYYLLCLLDIADKSDPSVRQMAENWIAATDRAMQQGANISGQLFRCLGDAAKESCVDA